MKEPPHRALSRHHSSASACMANPSGTTSYSVPCAFPFTYKGITYTSCTTIDHHRAWCKTKGLHHHDDWGHCEISRSCATLEYESGKKYRTGTSSLTSLLGLVQNSIPLSHTCYFPTIACPLSVQDILKLRALLDVCLMTLDTGNLHSLAYFLLHTKELPIIHVQQQNTTAHGVYAMEVSAIGATASPLSHVQTGRMCHYLLVVQQQHQLHF